MKLGRKWKNSIVENTALQPSAIVLIYTKNIKNQPENWLIASYPSIF